MPLFDAALSWSPDMPATGARPGLSFTQQDCLGLAATPMVRAATLSAFGVKSVQGPGPGPSAPVAVLEDRLAAFLCRPVALAYRSRTQAIRQTLGALLGPGDHVIVDAAAHPALAEAVLLSGAQLHRAPAASVDGVERRLSRLTRLPRAGRLVIAVPAVSSHASRIADLAELSALARQHRALLVADVTHDIGAMGPAGGGVAEIQACEGGVDILIGSFAPSFGAEGGFAAFRDPELKARLSQASIPALSPQNAAAILAALDIIQSPEGQRRRRNLHSLSLRLRNHLMADGIRPMGQASPFVPILLPSSTALARTALLESAGPRVTLLMAPAVPLHAPRWRIQLSAIHSPADIDDLAELIRDVSRAFDRQSIRAGVPA